MARFDKVNREIKKLFPELDIEAVRGEGYVYFDGTDGFGEIDSIMTNPATTSSEDLIEMCTTEIKDKI